MKLKWDRIQNNRIQNRKKIPKMRYKKLFNRCSNIFHSFAHTHSTIQINVRKQQIEFAVTCVSTYILQTNI